MGTFHSDKSALHGITVVVDTTGPKVYVGRCDDEDDEHVILLDADVHEDGQSGRSKQQYVERAAKFGVWKKINRIELPRSEVKSISRLGETAKALGTSTAIEPKAPPAPAVEAAPAKAPVASDGTQIIVLTPGAQEEVRRLIQADGKPNVGLRLGVKGGGCSGFTYKIEFDQKREGDVVVNYGDVNVYLDRKSVIYLRGITLDHQKGLQGKGFVFHNPNASNTCGCGESFSV
jgi:iron-sulfur cluster assembly protein